MILASGAVLVIAVAAILTSHVAAGDFSQGKIHQSFIRGGHSPAAKDRNYEGESQRDLGRVKARNGANSKSSTSTDYHRHREATRTCGACSDKDFAYIHLDGSYFFGEFNDNSTDTVPIETVGGLSSTKEGSTLRIFEDDLRGTAKYFDHYDKYPYKSDISGVIKGSCTVLATFPGNSSGVQVSEDCLAHCTICVSYTGLCCDSHGYGWDKEENCTIFGGFATVTGDLLFGVEQKLLMSGELQSIPLTEGGLVGLDGFGAITGTAGELGTASNGGLALIEYDAFSSNGDTYSIGLKVPFNDRASCKLQETILGGIRPPQRPSSPLPPLPTTSTSTPSPICQPTDCDDCSGALAECIRDEFSGACACRIVESTTSASSATTSSSSTTLSSSTTTASSTTSEVMTDTSMTPSTSSMTSTSTGEIDTSTTTTSSSSTSSSSSSSTMARTSTTLEETSSTTTSSTGSTTSESETTTSTSTTPLSSTSTPTSSSSSMTTSSTSTTPEETSSTTTSSTSSTSESETTTSTSTASSTTSSSSTTSTPGTTTSESTTTTITTTPECIIDDDCKSLPGNNVCAGGNCITEKDCSGLCDVINRFLYNTGSNSAKCCNGSQDKCNDKFGLNTTVFCSTECGNMCIGPQSGSSPKGGDNSRIPEIFCYVNNVTEIQDLGIPSCVELFEDNPNCQGDPFNGGNCTSDPSLVCPDGGPTPGKVGEVCCNDTLPSLGYPLQSCNASYNPLA